MTVANSLNPDYLIVEPSGGARPQNIIDELSKIVYERISLLVPILIVDGNNYKRAFDEFSELYGERYWIYLGSLYPNLKTSMRKTLRE